MCGCAHGAGVGWGGVGGGVAWVPGVGIRPAIDLRRGVCGLIAG